MRPKQPEKTRHDDLFRARLDQIINMKHALVVLADKIDWRTPFPTTAAQASRCASW